MNDRFLFIRAFLPQVDGPVAYYAALNRPPPTGEGEGKWEQIECESIEKVASILEREGDRAETYVALAAFAPGQGRKKDAVVAKSSISADIDDKEMPGATPEERHRNALALANALPVPAVVVDSGGGYHVHVRLPEGDRVEDFEDPAVGVAHVERLAVAFRRWLEAKAEELFGVRVELDHTHTAERVWRVPPGVNCKAEDGKKPLTADRGGWRRVMLAGRPEGLAGTPAADLAFLAPFMGREPAASEPAPDAPPGASRGFDPAILPADLRDRWPLAEGDQSDHDFAVCSALAEAGYGPDVMAEAIAARRALLPDAADRAKGPRLDYVLRTIANALHRVLRVTHAPHTPPEGCDASGKVRLVSAADYVAKVTAAIEWIWERVIPRGATVVVSGLPKVGKTTILFHLVRVLVCVTRAVRGSGEACDTREFLGRGVAQARVAWLALEEPPPLFRARLQELGLADAADLFVLDPDAQGIPSIDQLAALEAAITEGRIDILFADPLIDFFQVADENDAPEMARAFRKLREAIRRTGCTVVLIHHDKKGEGEGIKLVRGSTAITGAADVVVQVSAPFGETDPRRHVEVRGRYGLDEFDAILGTAGYELLTADQVERQRQDDLEARKRAREVAKARTRAETLDRAAEHLLAHPEGVTRAAAITALGLPVNEAKAMLDLATLKIGGRIENGGGSRPTRWFPPEPTGGDREEGGEVDA